VPELQLDEIVAAGCVRIWTDHATGTRADRPELAKVLDHMRAGDTLVVWRFDRLVRSLSDLITGATQLEQSGCRLAQPPRTDRHDDARWSPWSAKAWRR
jgi:DNA invertase Pin-like site-specific DNA recombinase